MASDELTRLFRVRRTICELLQERKYNVSDENLNMTIENFRDNYSRDGNIDRIGMRVSVSMIRRTAEDPEESIMVFFADEMKLGVKPIKEYQEQLTANGIKRCIVVIRSGITPLAKKAMDTYKDFGTIMELFKEEELLVNITKHKLVPKHTLLMPDEKKALLAKYKLKETQLPRIIMGDPISRYYGLRKGDVVKIERNSETAGRYVTYRLVS
jgi:DNA-directed RNA polymerases I, II, and III subunit RPABC1